MSLNTPQFDHYTVPMDRAITRYPINLYNENNNTREEKSPTQDKLLNNKWGKSKTVLRDTQVIRGKAQG